MGGLDPFSCHLLDICKYAKIEQWLLAIVFVLTLASERNKIGLKNFANSLNNLVAYYFNFVKSHRLTKNTY